MLLCIVWQVSCVHSDKAAQRCPSSRSSDSETWRAAEQDRYRSELLHLTNQFRIAHGRVPLASHRTLNRAALALSEQFLRRHSISHDGFPLQRQKLLADLKAPPQLQVRSENLAKVKSCLRSPEQLAAVLFALWVESPGHRRALLGPYQLQGAATRRQQDWHYASVFFY